MKKIYAIVFAFISIAFLLAALAFFIPMPFPIRFSLAHLIIASLINIAGAIILFLGLRGFKYRLRVAYLFIATSILMAALGAIQYPILGALNAFDSAWVRFGGPELFFLLTNISNYVGIYILVKLLNIEGGAAAKPWIVFGGSLAIGILTFLIPTPRTDLPAFAISMSAASFALQTGIVAAESVLLYKLMRQTSTLYADALKWLFITYFLTIFINAIQVLNLIFTPTTSWINEYRIWSLPYAFTAFCTLTSAVKFNRIRFAERILIATPQTSSRGDRQTVVDIVNSFASLASNPHAIDPILDEMRVITSSKKAGNTSFTDEEQKRLAVVYLRLEQYLITQEPARKFKLDDLRQMLETRFRGVVNESAFWQKIDASKSS